MASFNKVILLGNLTRDIELRHTSSSQAVANFGVAMNRRFRTAAGEDREETTFVDCEAWGQTGEVMAKYLSKGKPVFIEGRLKLDQWQDKDGNKQSKLRVVVENFQFVDSRSGGQGGGQGAGQGGGQPVERVDGGSREYARDGGDGGGRANRPQRAATAAPAPHEPVDDADIPF